MEIEDLEPKLAQVANFLQTLELPDNVTDPNQLQQLSKKYLVFEGKLYACTQGTVTLVVPRRQRQRIMKQCHNKAVHFGRKFTWHQLFPNFW